MTPNKPNNKVEEEGGTPWSRGGEYVYGDDETSEGLYALEDEAVVLSGVDGKWIPYYRAQDVMLLYRERLRTHIHKRESSAYEQGMRDERDRSYGERNKGDY